MPCLHAKIYLHNEAYFFPSFYQIHLYRAVYLRPVTAPNSTQTPTANLHNSST
jgi:hypothetical protein